MSLNIKEHQQSFICELYRKGCFRSSWLKEALLRVPRHHFIDRHPIGSENYRVIFSTVDYTNPSEDFLKMVYSDIGIVLSNPPNHSAASTPSLVLEMLYYLDVKPGDKVLEIGTGSGWNAGLLAFRVGDESLVYSMDIQADLVEAARDHLREVGFPNVNLRAADAAFGWSEKAPFDKIIVTVGCPDIPPSWQEQLVEGGKLLLPFEVSGVGDPLLCLEKESGKLAGSLTNCTGFETLQGAYHTEKESRLLKPYESTLEKLLATKPVKVDVKEPIDENTLFYAYLQGMRYTMVSPSSPTLWDREHDVIYSMSREKPHIYIRGDTSFAERWNCLLAKWIELGRPKITDYKVEVLSINQSPKQPGTWLLQRPSVTLEVYL